ncbi:hypothetical protein WPS_12280 [Vulcanimicrobium alpinum]|uniref:DUF4397 domain-containing protein n=1 Tax=Vulcanimicrobium alpinum TaxID=3016050 RepID=A0AAN2C9T8_UNVUL|nr:hypothetical protein [Vulcanimicrobium alpinum]BDE05952.1 hypothetical protein WPS_12280 [Vulcanimicrobium alpinum]
MRSLLARFAVLGTFAVSLAACSSGNGSTLPFAGTPNAAGANSGTFQAGASGSALLRFIQGSPDSGTGAAGAVDVCLDQQPLTPAAGAVSVAYKGASTLQTITSGIPHTISVYASLGGSNVGAECANAPNPYLGSAAIKTTSFTPAANTRYDLVLAGTQASKTAQLILFTIGANVFATAPAGAETISLNAAPAYTAINKGIGFGQCTTVAVAPATCGTPTVLAGAGNLASGRFATSPINGIPAGGFYDGIGVAAGNPVPVTVIAAPAAAAGQPYVINLVAVDQIGATTLGLIAIQESTLGYGF